MLEVNSVARASKGSKPPPSLDVAGAIVDYIASQVAFPELDVRQRLTVSTGYGVAELLIRDGANLVGTTIEEGLADRDIRVLTLTRGTTVIPNPRGSREMEAEDRLLCFGKLEAMRDLVPERRRRRARPKIQPLPDEPLEPHGE